jgi:heme/copper-type cytochrome/quinol oxidase subunit 2
MKKKNLLYLVLAISVLSIAPLATAGNNSFLDPGSGDTWYQEQSDVVKEKIESFIGMLWKFLQIAILGALAYNLVRYMAAKKGSDHQREAESEQGMVRILIGAAAFMILLYIIFSFMGWSV